MRSVLIPRNRKKACISDSSPPSKLPSKLCRSIEDLSVRNKEKAERDVLYQQLPFDALRYIKEENGESIFGNPEICKRLYPLVPPCLRSVEGLKRIVHSPSFKKNITMFQYAMNSLDVGIVLVGLRDWM